MSPVLLVSLLLLVRVNVQIVQLVNTTVRWGALVWIFPLATMEWANTTNGALVILPSQAVLHGIPGRCQATLVSKVVPRPKN